ncbi:UNVERIFIED_CONTAM: hypothetical protein K2H54_006694 [Gekko kuhli]
MGENLEMTEQASSYRKSRKTITRTGPVQIDRDSLFPIHGHVSSWLKGRMDDDPEPTLDQMILESHEGSEQLLSFGEQKCVTEIGEESPLESGDIGPAVDPESPKKPVAVKDLPTQTESKASIFRRKEWMDQSQQADLSDSIKSSTTSLRKPSCRSSQRLIGQESRRSSQQPAGQLPLLSQKPSRVQATNEADTKDPTWVSQRTGKVMKCRSQQTSLVWELKALSEILQPLSDESTPSKDEDSEYTTVEEDVTSSGETASERYPGQKSRSGSKQLEGKVSKHSSQQYLEKFGSRRSSQRSSEPPSALAQKYSQARPAKETCPDKDVTWISQKTGREMKCKAQQTSRTWGPKALSGCLCSSRQGSQVGREEESGLSAADELTSSGETGTEEPTAQWEGSVSKHASWQQFGRSEAHRNSQQTTAKERATEEQPLWTSQRAGKEMKCKAQQTSLVWEHKTLSDVLRVYSKVSEGSRPGEEDTTEDEDGDTKIDQAAMKDAQCTNQSLEGEDPKQDIQQVEERKAEPRRKKRKSKIDRSQQTDSAESIKKELADSSQQTDVSEGVQMSLVDLRQDSAHGSVEGSQRGSQELVRQDSGFSSPLPERQDSERSSQQSLSSEEKKMSPEEDETRQEDESRVPSDSESEPPKVDQKASGIREAEETTWVSRKTGRTVRNQSQQTDRSWLQYFALKSQKLKRCISQQTDESFLRRYKTGKQALREHRQSHTEPDMRRCTLCGDLYGDELPFDLDTLSSFSTMSILSTISSQDTTEAESGDEQEPSTSGGDDEQPQTPPSLPQKSRRGSQLWGQESPKDAERESQLGSLQAVDDPAFVRWANESESSMASESSSLYMEAEDKIQQTYSMISFEDGIWLNRKTGKLLVTHSQQTSGISVAMVSGRALEKSGSTEEEEEGPAPTEVDDSGAGVNQDLQQETEVDGQPPSGQGSQRGSQQDGNGESHLLPVEPTGEELQSADEVEKLVCSRLSEATLLSIESPDMEDGPVQIYAVVSLEKGSFRNIQTGKLLASQSQQTVASSPQNATGDEEAAEVPSQETLEECQVDLP